MSKISVKLETRREKLKSTRNKGDIE